MDGRFFLFINFKQAAALGHVGWGFLYDSENKIYVYGATDHLYRHHELDLPGWIRYMHVEPGNHTDWWCERGSESDMMRAMQRSTNHIWYHSAKVVEVPNANPVKAETMALSQETSGWAVLTNNCVQQTFDVARAYGADKVIPDPWRNPFNLVPRIWFNSFEGPVRVLNTL